MSRMPAKPAPAKGAPPGFNTTIESVVSVHSILTASFYYYPSVKAKKFCITLHGLNFQPQKDFQLHVQSSINFILRVFLSDNGGQLLSVPQVLQSAKLYVYGIYRGMAFGRTTSHVSTSSCARLFASSFCCISSLHFCTISKILPSKPCTLIRRGKGCFIIQSLLIS